jgi:hypothetical protein
MTTYTITADTNINTLAGKTGGDTYTVNGGTLRINTDTRLSLNASSTLGPFGAITLSPTLGGHLVIDGTATYSIPYTGGSGTVPAYGTTIVQGGFTAKFAGVMSLATGGVSTAPAAAMPATGFIKLTEPTGTYTTGALAGITATASAAMKQSFIVVVGQDAATLTTSALGSVTINGGWFEAGTTNGARGQAIQLPHYTADTSTFYPGVEIETAAGSGLYEFWPNAGLYAISTSESADSRNKNVRITAAGSLVIGQGTDAVAAMALPATGCKIRVPNVILQSAASALRQTNVCNVVLTTRYEFGTLAGGTINVSGCTGCWYFNLVQPNAVNLVNLHTCDSVIIDECRAAVIADGLHVGLSTQAAAIAAIAINIYRCYKGGTLGVISGLRATSATTSEYAANLSNLAGTWTVGCLKAGYATNPTTVSAVYFISQCYDMTFTKIIACGKRGAINQSKNIIVNAVQYADKPLGVTDATLPSTAVEVLGPCENVTVSNITIPVANTYPYTAITYANASKNIKFNGLGIPAAVVNLGITNGTGVLFNDGGNNHKVSFSNIWVSNLRTGLATYQNTSKEVNFTNVYNNTVLATPTTPLALDSVLKGVRSTTTLGTSYPMVEGTHFYDGFTTDTVAIAGILMIPKTDYTVAAYTTTGTPKFTYSGTLKMLAGDVVEWTWSHFILGWNGFSSVVQTGTNLLNHNFEYAVDTGTGFGAWKPLELITLLAQTGIDPVAGFKLKVRATCTVSDPNNAITAIQLLGTTTLALQNAAIYPATEQASLVVDGITAGTTVALFASPLVAGATPVVSAVSVGSSVTLNYSYNVAAPGYVLRVRKAGYYPIEKTLGNLQTSNQSVTLIEVTDSYGVAIYGTGAGTTDANVTIDGPAQRIDIAGFTQPTDAFDVVSEWQATTGIAYPEALRTDGDSVLLMGDWRLRRTAAGNTSAGIEATGALQGQPGVSPVDTVNGGVNLTAPSSGLTAVDIAFAVRLELALELARLDANVSKAVSNAALAAALSA